MAYTPTVWKDRIVQFARRFTKTGETGTGVTLTPDPGIVTEGGTPVNAANMNKIEQGIDDAHLIADNAYALAGAAKSTADAALPKAGLKNGQTDALIGIRKSGNAIEWGHSNPAGYQSVLGSESNSGSPFIALNAEAGTTANTYRTRGLPGVVLKSNNNGKFLAGTVPLANADNQIPTWYELWDKGQMRWNIGRLEVLDGGVWVPVGGVTFPEWLARLSILNDGTDGAYNASSTQTIPSGIHRFTTFNINSGVTVTPVGNFAVILVKGVATINGTLSASGKGGAGGPQQASEGSVVGGKPGSAGKGGLGAGGGGGGYSTGGGTTGGKGGNGGGLSTDPQGGIGGGSGGGQSSQGVSGGGTNINIVSMNNTFESFRDAYGAGGGSGMSGPGTGAIGGVGGAGGGLIIIIAETIVGNGAIRADGINGSNGGPIVGAQGNAGGGGGGGGLIFASAHAIATTIAMSANAGSGGSPTVGTSGVGYVGGSGGVGYVQKFIG